ncbi:hypothetical protein C8F01DRAFT_124565 [Mycena amicta]|nr:hypothetical protein C8F01DRAFT_124565 [Mycena amicta]
MYSFAQPSYSSVYPQPPTWGTAPTSPSSSSAPNPTLPYPTGISPLDFGLSLEPVTLTVAPHEVNKTILDANLLRADGRPRFFVSTDASRTVIEDGSRARVALINWRAGPTVLVDELGCTFRTAEWLYLTSSRTCRTMIAHGRQFSWRPNGSSIELFPLEDSVGLNVLARISLGPNGTVLQLAPRALHLKLLNAVVISAVLLMSGRNID